jgi:hypothetical protein
VGVQLWTGELSIMVNACFQPVAKSNWHLQTGRVFRRKA